MDLKSKIKKAANEIKKEWYFSRHEKPPVRILFDHLPKCGGRTFKWFLESNFLWRETYSIPGKSPREAVARFKNFPETKRHSYRLVEGHMADQLIECVSDDFLCLTMLRDPVERIVSHYYFAKGLRIHYLHDTIHREGLTLEQYATGNLSDELWNWYTQHFSGFGREELQANPDKGLEKAKTRLRNRYQFVGLLARMDEFIELICRETGLIRPAKIARLNQTARPAGREAEDQVARKKIAQVNHLDVKLYNHVVETYFPENCGELI